MKEILIKDTLTAFKIYHEAKGNSRRTIDWYNENLSRFVNYIEAEEGISGISKLTLAILRNYLVFVKSRTKWADHPTISKEAVKGKISSKTVQTYARALRGWLAWLYKEKYIHEDLAKTFTLPKATKKVIEILKQDEIESILSSFNKNSAMGMRNYCIFALMVDCGLRLSEVIRLNLQDIIPEQNFIKVLGKGDKERIVPIGTILRKNLNTYIIKFRQQLITSSEKALFLSSAGNRLNIDAIGNVFKRIKTKTGISKLHPHLCRHTFATNYLMHGGDIMSLQQILGHTSLEMVRNYMHLANSYICMKHKQLSTLDKIGLYEGRRRVI